MVNKDVILKVFHSHFTIRAGASYTGTLTVDKSGRISAHGHVFLKTPMSQLPLSFARVEGDFGANDKQLLSMQGFPEYIGGDLEAAGNQITSLESCPKYIGGLCVISTNLLTSLEGVPQSLNASFDCRQNNLKTLEGGPSTVNGDFRCEGNKLTNLVGAPLKVTGWLTCANNPLTSLEGIPTELGGIELEYNRDLPLLRLLYAKQIDFYFAGRSAKIVTNILNKYAGQGRSGAIDCKRELVAAGFEGNAKW